MIQIGINDITSLKSRSVKRTGECTMYGWAFVSSVVAPWPEWSCTIDPDPGNPKQTHTNLLCWRYTLCNLCAELFKRSALAKLTFLSVHRISSHCWYCGKTGTVYWKGIPAALACLLVWLCHQFIWTKVVNIASS